MRKITRSILATTAVVGLLAIPVAATADTTTVTFTVANTGGLSVATANATPTLGPFDTGSSLVGTAALPQMTVTDNTNKLAGTWTVTVGATSFSDGGTNTIPGTAIGYYSGVATNTSTLPNINVPVGQQPLAANAVTLNAQRDAVLATGVTGNNSATFTPTLRIDLTGVAPATYSGTIVHSVTGS